MNQKIKQIEWAIQNANLFKSKLTEEALKVPFMGSLKIRHLLNNLGAMSTRYFEVGSHKGGSFCSTVAHNDNLINASAVDNFTEFNEDADIEKTLLANVFNHISTKTAFHFFNEDCFGIEPHRVFQGIDLYLWDGPHGREQHLEGAKHFVNAMADEFIFCCDDWTFPGVEEGTRLGIKESGVEIVKEWIMMPENGIFPNDSWWNGYSIFLLKK